MTQMTHLRGHAWVPVVIETPLVRPTMNFGPPVPNEMGAEIVRSATPQSYVGAGGVVNNSQPPMFNAAEAPLAAPTWEFDRPSASSNVVLNGHRRSVGPTVGSLGNATPGGEAPLVRRSMW